MLPNEHTPKYLAEKKKNADREISYNRLSFYLVLFNLG